jgi:ABC-type phosphate transport system auxiliary subunit
MLKRLAKDGWRALAVVGALGGVVYASYHQGVPKKLPGAAFDWVFLFHVERATALLAALGLVLLVGVRALRGEFPIKFGQLEYPAKEVDEKTQAATAAQERRIQLLEDRVYGVPPSPRD